MAKSNPSTGAGRGKQQAGGSTGKGGGGGGGQSARGGGGGGQAARGGGAAQAKQGSGGRRGSAGGGGSGKSQQQGERLTGTPDEHYNLISVLYHALKGAQTYAQYVQDAEEAGDAELASFLRQVQGEEQSRAERAKALLGTRVGGGSAGMGGDADE
jgi:hypothetical protein